jgi:hypothetical protein
MSVLEALVIGTALAVVFGIACEMGGRAISNWIEKKEVEHENDSGEMDY